MPAQSWPTFVLPKKKNQALHNVASIIVIQTSNHTMHTLTDTNSTASPRAHFRQHCCAGDKKRRHKPQNIGQSTIKLIGKRKTNRATATIREQAKKADVDASAATANAGGAAESSKSTEKKDKVQINHLLLVCIFQSLFFLFIGHDHFPVPKC